MADSMIERMARSLCRQNGHAEDIAFEGAPMWKSYVETARGVLADMREPTGGMEKSVGGKLPDESAYCWRAMIDAALGE